MMKTAIVYYSRHHGNTKKLVDAIGGIAKKHPNEHDIPKAVTFFQKIMEK